MRIMGKAILFICGPFLVWGMLSAIILAQAPGEDTDTPTVVTA